MLKPLVTLLKKSFTHVKEKIKQISPIKPGDAVYLG